MLFKPNKAYTIELNFDGSIRSKVPSPCLVSYKLDGIRGYRQGLTFYSNSGKPLPSKYIQSLAQHPFWERFGTLIPDGEWLYGDPTNEHCYELTSSAVMSIEWPAHLDKSQLRFYVFDLYMPGSGYTTRSGKLLDLVKTDSPEWLVNLAQFYLHSEDLVQFYEQALALGYEGIMVRSPGGLYKCGRSTEKEGGLGKLKPYGKELHEAEIIGWYPLTRTLESRLNEQGYLKASKAADNLEEVEAIGGFLVRDCSTGIEFRLGGGKLFTKSFRYDNYSRVADYIGQLVQYKSMTYGVKDKPRQPTAYRLRSPLDMTQH